MRHFGSNLSSIVAKYVFSLIQHEQRQRIGGSNGVPFFVLSDDFQCSAHLLTHKVDLSTRERRQGEKRELKDRQAIPTDYSRGGWAREIILVHIKSHSIKTTNDVQDPNHSTSDHPPAYHRQSNSYSHSLSSTFHTERPLNRRMPPPSSSLSSDCSSLRVERVCCSSFSSSPGPSDFSPLRVE